MVDVLGVIRKRFALDMGNVCEMVRVIVSATTLVITARFAILRLAVQATEHATSMVPVIVSKAGQDNRWIVVFVHRKSSVVVTVNVTTT